MSGIPIQISTIKNSDSSFGVSVPPGANYVLPDITNTDVNGDRHSVPGEKNWTDPATPTGGTVKNSDNSYSESVPGGGTLVLPDITLTEPNGTGTSFPASKNIAATQIPNLADQDLQNQLSESQRNSLDTIYTLPTGQTTSYATGDDGDLKHGRLTDFFTLKCNNSFGNTNRFTDESGLQVYPSNYVIDHATGLGWYRTEQTAAELWADAIAAANAFSLVTAVGTLNGFFLPNMLEFLSIMNMQNVNNSTLNYAPFNIGGTSTGHWTSTTISNPNTSAIKISVAVLPQFTTAPKSSSSAPYFMCRMHNIPS